MAIPLRILIVEDNPDDAELAILHLTQAGFRPDWQRVETEAAYLSALEPPPDLILSDWSLPYFSGLRALRLRTERKLDIPFIIVSGGIGEEAAIDAIHNGADDYVLKDRPARLGESVRRALADKQLRAQRQQAEQALRAAEEKYRAIFDGALEGIYQSTPAGRFITVNPALARMWGYDTPEQLVSGITDIASQVYVNMQRRAEFARILEMNDEIQGFEYQARRKDGALMWASEHARAVRDAGGTLLYYEGSIEDITERKRTEETLRESEKRQRFIFASLPVAVFAGPDNPDCDTTWISGDVKKITGFENDEYLSENDFWRKRLHPEDKERVLDAYKNYPTDSELILEYRWRCQNGQYRWFQDRSTLLENEHQREYLGVIIDITERKQAEESLKLRESYLTAIIENQPGLISLKDLDGRFLTVNGVFSRACKKKISEILGKTDLDVWPREFAEKYRADDAEVIKQKIPLHTEESIFDEGQVKWFETFKMPILDETLQVIGVTSFAREITARKRAEQTLRESESRLKEAQRMALIGNWELDLVKNKLSWSDEIYRIFEIEPAAFNGSYEAFLNMIHPDDRESVKRAYAYSLEEQIPYEVVYRVLTPPFGDIKYMQERCETFYDADGHPLRSVGTTQDITKSRRAEEHIQKQLEHLSALHNIDNAIKSSTDLHTTLKVFLDEVAAQLKVDAASILLLNNNALTLDYAASHGFNAAAFLQSTKLEIGQGYAGRVILDRKTIHIPNLTKTESQLAEALARAGENFMTYVGAPLIAKGQVVGVLEIFQRSPLAPDPEWFDFLDILAGQAAIAIDSAQLFENLQRSNFDLLLAYDATIEGWSRAMDLRDHETEGHTQRVTTLSLKLARQMGIPDTEMIHVRRGALLHDIGKIGVPDRILLKPDILTADEWEIMRQHPTYAYEMLNPILYLKPALDIPHFHHEKWDGTGYPDKRKGADIPFSARIFAVVDAWDAVTSIRPYRSPWSKEKAIEYIKSESGKHFDPQVVETFLRLISNE